MILLMGIPGSGKGTQGKLLAEKRALHNVSTGELLRTYGSADQHARMHTGVILGDEEVTQMLDNALADLPVQNDVILDGYPRTIKQSDWLLGQTKSGRFTIDGVVFLQASPTAVKERLKERGRTDDDGEIVDARFREYEQSTLPIIKHLRDSGIPIIEINGEQSVNAVHQDIISRLTSI
jgi:adenylate kinase